MCADLKSLAMGAAQIWRQITHALEARCATAAPTSIHAQKEKRASSISVTSSHRVGPTVPRSKDPHAHW